MSDAPGPVVIRAPRLLALTGIRFVAAIAVFNAHLPLPAAAPIELRTISLAGHDWMTMFFVLSGLILTWNYDDLLGERLTVRGLRTYVVARFARIYPLYLFALAFVVVLTMGPPLRMIGVLTQGTFWRHFFALQAWSSDIGVAYGFNAPGWSIGVEFFLYALLPLLLLGFKRIRMNLRALVIVGAAAIALIALVTLAFQSAGLDHAGTAAETIAHRWLYRNPLTRIPDFVLGIVLCLVIRVTATRNYERPGRVAQIVGGVLILSFTFVPAIIDSVWSYDVINLVPWALVFLGLVWAPDTLLARLLGSRPLVFLGECSFAIYLLHQTFITVIPRLGSGYVGWLESWVVDFAITVVAAAVVHVLFERPVRSWLRRRLDPRPPITPTPLAALDLPAS